MIGAVLPVEIVESVAIAVNADVVVPTGQNQINIEQDIKKLVQEHLNMPRDKIKMEVEKLIRAYDPCMSCSTHFLEIEWDVE